MSAMPPDSPLLGANPAVELPRQPGALWRTMRAYPRWVDATIAGLYLLGTATLAVADHVIAAESSTLPAPDYLQPPRVLLLVLIVAVTFTALLLRRRYPLWGLAAVLVVSSFIDMTPVAATMLAVWVLLYSVPVYRSVPVGWVGYGLAVAASLLALPLQADLAVAGPDGVLTLAIASAVVLLVPLMIGINAGNRRRYTEAIIDRAHQLARERDQLARLAVAEERSRIAREMHDIVAHSVSVMVMLSEGAARAVEIDPVGAARAMEQSAETGRTALAEMRRLLGALRDPPGEAPAELAPTPDLEALPDLVEGFRAAGLTVELSFRGQAGRVREQGRELAIFRIVQEALTNTLRHAGPGAVASVLVEEQAAATLVRITDDGGNPDHPAPMAGVGSGQGLAGVAERVRMFGGELTYGPVPPRGWRVVASLPAIPSEKPTTIEVTGARG